MEAAFNEVLYLLHHCAEAYEKAPPEVQRLLNQTFFEKFYVETSTITGSDISEPFAAVLAHDFQAELEATGKAARGANAISRAQGSNKLRLAPSKARYSNPRSGSNKLRLAPSAGRYSNPATSESIAPLARMVADLIDQCLSSRAANQANLLQVVRLCPDPTGPST